MNNYINISCKRKIFYWVYKSYIHVEGYWWTSSRLGHTKYHNYLPTHNNWTHNNALPTMPSEDHHHRRITQGTPHIYCLYFAVVLLSFISHSLYFSSRSFILTHLFSPPPSHPFSKYFSIAFCQNSYCNYSRTLDSVILSYYIYIYSWLFSLVIYQKNN